MENLLKDTSIGKIVDFDPVTNRLYPFDFTENNKEIVSGVFADTNLFSKWITDQLSINDCRYGIGGYNEHRTIYARSAHFDAGEEPRRLHLGVDIWGPAGTPVYNFHDAEVHSFKFNDNFGDYGATIILKYKFDGLVIHALYGHLSLKSLEGLEEGQFIQAGKQFAAFGVKKENGYWPPHLHFQLIYDMEGMTGDYPGVCQYTRKEHYLANCPDPRPILARTFKTSLL